MVDVHRTRSTRTFPIGLRCTRLDNQYDLFIFEVLKAWTNPAQKDPKSTARMLACSSCVPSCVHGSVTDNVASRVRRTYA
jgi:hypothetical protein